MLQVQQLFHQSQENQDCSICFNTCVRPVMCKGPCHKIFCLSCATLSRVSDKRCPNRCSQVFQIQIYKKQQPYMCPFSPSKCVINIASAKQFDEHHKSCMEISAEQRQQVDFKNNYLCKKGHPLTFVPGQGMDVLFGTTWSSQYIQNTIICCNCEDKTIICRSLCLVCSIKQKLSMYCAKCRPFPCTKTKCPLGHKLKKSKRIGRYRYCDLCDFPAKVTSNQVHGYCPCNFDICKSCHQSLPDENSKIPLKFNKQKLWPLSVIEDDQNDSDWNEQN